MNTWKVILATMLIFGTGVVTGGLLVDLLVEQSPHYPEHRSRPVFSSRPPQSVSPAGTRLDFLRRIEAALDLTPEQREHIDQILKDSQERTRKFISPRIREETQRARSEFREVLNPEQRARFDELVRQQHPRDQRKGGGQHPPPPSPTQTNAAETPTPAP